MSQIPSSRELPRPVDFSPAKSFSFLSIRLVRIQTRISRLPKATTKEATPHTSSPRTGPTSKK